MKYDQLYIDLAHRVAQQSYDIDHKVGAVVVTKDGGMWLGWNGMPTNMDNDCKLSNGHTKKEVLHAETNAIAKLARSTASSEGGTIYTTLAPCLDCAKLIYQSGITRVVFSHDYKDDQGKLFLIERLGIENITGLPESKGKEE